jgi:threonylcarbamoyladenosine tRNA methylthiotransferase MtaB
MRTFSIQTLGCKVNQYEAEQIAALLRARGLAPAADAASADLRIVHTCSVTAEAAAKSRQLVRRAVRGRALPVLDRPGSIVCDRSGGRTVVTGCWASSNPADATAIPGVAAVIGHRDDVAARLHRLLDDNQPIDQQPHDRPPPGGGTTSLPLLGQERSGHQRAFVKVQDGCDAHCTYCIIPNLRPNPWSKSIDACVQEVKRLVDRGHAEIVLTGIFLGAYGHETALRRRQAPRAGLVGLIDALCGRVRGLRRLRLSSLEPGDLTCELISALRSHGQIVPHFHLPLQSGSDAILRRMNRRYRRGDYLRMIDRVRDAFDRPAITTDVIAGFPGESDDDFAETIRVVDHARFVHAHAFPFSPRPGTAAGRWGDRFVPPAVTARRMAILERRSLEHSHAFRSEFIGRTVEILVERPRHSSRRVGRCERYFEVEVQEASLRAGDLARVRVERVDGDRTFGSVSP